MMMKPISICTPNEVTNDITNDIANEVTNLAGYCALSTRIGRTSTTADLARSLVVVVAAAAVAAPRRRGPCLDSLRIALLVRRGLRVCDFEF